MANTTLDEVDSMCSTSDEEQPIWSYRSAYSRDHKQSVHAHRAVLWLSRTKHSTWHDRWDVDIPLTWSDALL